MLTNEFINKVEAFCQRVADHADAYRKIHYPSLPPVAVVADFEYAKKYVRISFVDVTNRSSRYFVEVVTGKIFACESWKKPNLKRFFGTIEEIDEFDWSGYEGRALPTSKYTMKDTRGSYQTAVLK